MSHSCSGCCGSCSGCAKELTLTDPEIRMLRTLGQIPFLPIARRADDMTPIYLEESDRPVEEYSMILTLLERKGLIDLDYRQPLSGFDMAAYHAYPVQGSMALTARGQSVLETLDLQGCIEE